MIRVLYNIIGENDKLPHIAETEIKEFLEKFQKEAVFTLRMVVFLCLLAWIFTPLLTIFVPLPTFLLSKKMCEKHTRKLTTNKIYILRQTMMLLKQFVGLIWGANNKIRNSINLKPYESNPDRFKIESHNNGHSSFVSKSKNKKLLKLEADYVIVGSGAGGSAVAIELARAGLKIVMIEAGPWLEPKDYPNSFYGTLKNTFDNWGANATIGKSFSPIVQARCVGGTPVINSSIVVRTPENIFDLWKKKCGINISHQQILKFQEKIEQELSVQQVNDSYLGQSNKLAIKAAESLHINGNITDRNVKDCQGSGNCLAGCKNNKKKSPNVTWIPEILARGNILLSCAPAQKIIIKNGKAEKVIGNFVHPYTKEQGCKFSISAKKGIILAASATHTPCILQRSKLVMPALGRNFKAHPGSTVIGIYPEPVMNKNMIGATQGWATTQFQNEGFKLETINMPLELLISRLPDTGKNFTDFLELTPYMALWVAVVKANNSEGTVRYNRILDKPNVYYTMTENDIKKLQKGMYVLANMHFAAGAKTVLPGIYDLPQSIGKNETDLIMNAGLNPQNYFTILSHLFGGAIMGTDQKNSVCDVNGKVHGIQGLYIADASAIPTVLGVNPQHTIMALAMRLAHHLI